jgi:hypothetical protein
VSAIQKTQQPDVLQILAEAHTAPHVSPQTTTGKQFSRLEFCVKRSCFVQRRSAVWMVPEDQAGAWEKQFLQFSK